MASHAVQQFDGAGHIITVPVRGVVHDFAVAMEEQLLLNDHKGGWRDEEISWLIGRAREELAELEDAVRQKRPVLEVLGEAADVGNFAMMVADVYAHDQVDHEPPAPTPVAEPAATDVMVRATAIVPPFGDGNGRAHPGLQPGDVATVPPGVAAVLFRRGKAVPVEVAA